MELVLSAIQYKRCWC